MNRTVMVLLCCCLAFALPGTAPAAAAEGSIAVVDRFEPADVFELEYASDPRISPSGDSVVYVRNSMDITSDRRHSQLWIVDVDGGNHRPLTTGDGDHFLPRWSPDGERLLYVSRLDGSAQIYLRWMDTGQTAKLTNLTRPPRAITWSPDGQWIAFAMMVPEVDKPFVEMPPKPDGAEWSAPAKVIQKLVYRSDSDGYLENGYSQLFVLPADGGTPRQVTSGSFHHNGPPSWTPDSEALIFAANRHEGWEYEPLNSEVYELTLADGSIAALTDRFGPDTSPVVSPDGRMIAYIGFDDRFQGYQLPRLYVMNRDGSDKRLIASDFDRAIEDPVWTRDGSGLRFLYDDEGDTKLGAVSLRGEVRTVASGLGSRSIGRPYSGASFSMARSGRLAFTVTDHALPADVAIGGKGSRGAKRLTQLNEDLLGHKELGSIEEVWFRSSFDRRSIQGWIVKPPAFDPGRKYPLILEIHGGPFANYGDRFAAEIQLYAAAGYVVLYANPRGSDSYGEEFGNLIHHNYPGEDYDDLMSGVDAVIERGYVNPDNLFVTGGSGGGVLSSWIVGKTGRFRAAVVAKPVINWYSFVLTSDNYNVYYKYWFPGFPWDFPEHYLKRSSLSLVGNVTTPTMLLTGEADHRTPISESEQFYQALKLRKIDAALVRIPGATHGIASRPSRLISKVLHILKWFETYRVE